MRPVQIASGDFNGDGRTDFVVTNAQTNTIYVLLGNASGVPAVVGVNSVIGPRRVGVADFNHDGKPDLAVSHVAASGAVSVAVLLGDGAGGFGPPTDFPATDTQPLIIADFNNDGNPDIFLGNNSSNSSEVLLGNGSGGFGAPVSAVVASNVAATAGDFNNDGKTDLIVVNGSITVEVGDGTGHFGLLNNFFGNAATSVSAADFNGDGKLDIVTGGQADGISVLLGNGAGSFGAAKSISTGFLTTAVATGDFNGDGKADIVAVGHSTVVIFIGDGNGGFGPATSYTLNQSPVGVTVGDFDGDGKPDVATANVPPDGSFPNLNGPTNDTATILLGDGAGKLRYASVLNTNGNPFAVAAADLNGDGKADLVSANIGDNNVSVMLGDGAGGFGAPSTFAVGTQPRSVVAADLNGDGKPDIVTANFSANTVSILFGTGSGGFGAPTQLSVPGFGPDYVAVGDFNNDGKPDLAVAYLNAGSVSIMLGDGSGGFGPATNFVVPSGAQQVVVNDFNGDGKADLAVATISGVAVLLGDGNGGFGAAKTLQTPATASSVAVGDFNGDGRADLVAAVTNTSTVLLYLGDGQGGFAAPLSFKAGGGPVSLAVADYNGDGNADVAAANGGPVAILLGDGAGGFADPVVYVTPGPVSRAIVSADFNSDARPDLAVANQGGSVVPTSNPPPGNVSVLFNKCSAAPPSIPTLSVGDVAVTEGDSGTTNATFNVTLSAASNKTVAVSFYTAAQDAQKDVDYKSVSGRLSFAPGVTSQTITVPVVGDTLDEFDEHFLVILAHPLNAQAGKGQGRGTILDDDPPPSASINDVALDEGNAGTKQATFTVSLSAPSGKPISISFATADGSANAGTDYQTTTGTLTFSPGQTAATLSVPVIGDTAVEPDETFFVNLTDPVNVTLARAQGVGTIINDDTSVQFSAAALEVSESAGLAQLTVTRVGLLTGTSAVNYATSDGTASERSDYNLALGTLQFAPGETSKTVTVFITDDALVENPETFNVTLSSPAGCTLGSPSAAVVTIDSDGAANGPNPSDASPFFVRQHYRDFLNRDPDASGFNFWTQNIESCGTDTNCREVKRIDTSAAFFLSIEFQETGYLVYRIYKTAFGDATSPGVSGTVPVIRLQEFMADTQRIGQGVIVGQGSWQQQLEDNKNSFALEFVQRQRFTTAFPSSMAAGDFVNQLNTNAGGGLTDADKTALISALGSTPADPAKRASVLRQVAESQALKTNEFNRAFVLMQYYGYLRRNPDDTPDGDFRGWQFWLQKLNQFGGDYVQAEMVKAFISSAEYRQRFGP
jgi:hypothetical protein